MPENRSYRKELLKGIDEIEKLRAVLNDIINEPVQKNAWNTRVIIMLVHACDYLQANVRILKDRLVS